jgi:probable rRNA maturation factor
MSSFKPEKLELALDLSLGAGIQACPIDRAKVRRIVLASITLAGKTLRYGAQINLRLCNVAEAKSLNRAHRNKTYAPNVLTFEYPSFANQPLTADIAICLPVLRTEAAQQGKTMENHFAHLLTHGCLHALGFDHLDENQASVMEDLERQILRRFRIQDPYLVGHKSDGKGATKLR